MLVISEILKNCLCKAEDWMSIINYSHASELEQVHREEIQSRLCNQEPSLNSPPGLTPTPSRKASVQVSHDWTHTATHTYSTSTAAMCKVSQRPHEPETTHQTFYYNVPFPVLTEERALTLHPTLPSTGFWPSCPLTLMTAWSWPYSTLCVAHTMVFLKCESK